VTADSLSSGTGGRPGPAPRPSRPARLPPPACAPARPGQRMHARRRGFAGCPPEATRSRCCMEWFVLSFWIV
jgi:hypothetical protein